MPITLKLIPNYFMKISPVLKTINRKFIVLSSDLHSFSHKCSDAPLQLLSCPQEETQT